MNIQSVGMSAADSREQIMEATYHALRKHGYANLTIAAIADEFDKGKSLIYYHFDDKEELLLAFLDHMQEHLKHDLLCSDETTAEEQFDRFLEMGLAIDRPEMQEFRKALYEIRSQTPHNQAYADKFAELDHVIHEQLADMLDDIGVDAPGETATLILATMDGAVLRTVTTDRSYDLTAVKHRLLEFVQDRKAS